MQPMSDADNQALQEFRGYLETLTFIQIDPRLRSKFDLSDIIQNTLLEAFRDLERMQESGLTVKEPPTQIFIHGARVREPRRPR
jgi:hypothetical protein